MHQPGYDPRVICSRCQHDNPLENALCGSCGRALDERSPRAYTPKHLVDRVRSSGFTPTSSVPRRQSSRITGPLRGVRGRPPAGAAALLSASRTSRSAASIACRKTDRSSRLAL